MGYKLIGLIGFAVAFSLLVSSVSAAKPGSTASTTTFSNTALLLDSGSSEPAVTIGPDGTTVFTSLSWITFGTNVWKTSFGGSPAFQGIPDNGIVSGQLGGEDADVDIGSTGTLHFTSLIALVNPPFTAARFGVSAITCGNADVQGGHQKATSANFNNIVVSRSIDKGLTWVPTIVSHAPVNNPLNNVFPALAVDPASGKAYASWSDAHTVWFAASSDHGSSWTSAVAVNSGSAATAVFPWVAAFAGKVDVVYYGTTASSKDDPAAVWNTYMAQTTDDGSHFVQTTVSAHANHVGVICTFGTGCARGTRNLLDLFEVAINLQSGKAAIIVTDDTLTGYTRSDGTVAPLTQE